MRQNGTEAERQKWGKNEAEAEIEAEWGKNEAETEMRQNDAEAENEAERQKWGWGRKWGKIEAAVLNFLRPQKSHSIYAAWLWSSETITKAFSYSLSKDNVFKRPIVKAKLLLSSKSSVFRKRLLRAFSYVFLKIMFLNGQL